MDHPFLGLFAYQEALLIEAVFGVALLVMLWVGFRRWLQYKERLGQLIARETAQRAVQHGAHMESVEARLKALEQRVSDGASEAALIGAAETSPLPSQSPGATRSRQR